MFGEVLSYTTLIAAIPTLVVLMVIGVARPIEKKQWRDREVSREENTSRAENDEASRRESNAASQQESNVASLQKSPEPGRNRESPRGWNNLMALLAGIAIGPVIWLFSKGVEALTPLILGKRVLGPQLVIPVLIVVVAMWLIGVRLRWPFSGSLLVALGIAWCLTLVSATYTAFYVDDNYWHLNVLLLFPIAHVGLSLGAVIRVILLCFRGRLSAGSGHNKRTPRTR